MSNVSIIIPAYNQSRFLGAAIDSCLQQSHTAIEVVVVDDGSTDDTPRVAARYKDRVKYVRQDNQGLAAARNRGIRESSGDYLCFLDSDDFYAPDKILRQAALLDDDNTLAFVYCDIATVDDEGKAVPDAPLIANANRPLSGNLFDSLMAGGFFPPHTVMIRRAVLEEVGGFDPALGGHADYELWLRISGAGHTACFIPDKLASYRTYPTSMSKDGEHMTATRRATLGKIARLHPEMVGESINGLQQSNEDLFRANQWLRGGWERALSGTETPASSTGGRRERYDFLRQSNRAALVKGGPEQKAVWDVTLGDVPCKALLLQPPAELVFELPTFFRGQLRTAVAIHPDAWSKPGAGGCEFRIRADGRLAYAVALDPVRCTGDRLWHPIQLDIPENPAGAHKVVFETRTVGSSSDFRWALWRAPEFSWAVPGAPDSVQSDPVLNAA